VTCYRVNFTFTFTFTFNFTILYHLPLSAFLSEYIPRYTTHTFCLTAPHQYYFLSKLGSLGSRSLYTHWNRAYNVTAYRWILHVFASDPHGVIASLSELQWKQGVRIPTTDRHFSLQNVQSSSEAHIADNSMVTGDVPRRVERSGHEITHLPP